ncbi:DNA topoisomerase VI subunit B [Candidatus Micrarchaeota archaeon]|nr:DNA topoisomerase VI subunit B [Candidatus Micrarchaeota archaeon]
MAEKTVADEMFSEFQEHSVAEFFRKNRQMLGFYGKVRSLTTIVHEYITNSLDACEEAGILPDLKIELRPLEGEHVKVISEDNGPGIPKSHIGKALAMMLAGTKFHRHMQMRGQQGIGASGCTMFAQMTTGKPVHVKSGTGQKVVECDLSIDVQTNKPLLMNVVETDSAFHGLVVEAEFAEVKYDRSEYSPFEYLKRSALANPHAQITFIDPSEKLFFPRASDVIPKRPSEVQPHPLGITTNDLIDLAHHCPARKISSFFTSTFARFSSTKVSELRSVVPDIDLEKVPRELKWAEAEAIVKAFQQMKWVAPATDSLQPIGEDQIEKAFKNILGPEFFSVRSRKPKVFRGGVPFVVEAAVAYGGKSGRSTANGTASDIQRFANRAPLLFDAGGCAITEAIKTIDWKRYDIDSFESTPLSVFVNFVSVYVPYTGAGKQAISPEEEVVSEIRFAIMEVARDLQRYLSGKVRESDREAKKKAIMRYVHQLSLNLPELAGAGKSSDIEESLIKLIQSKYAKSLNLEAEEEEKEEENAEKKSNGNGEEEKEE